MVCGDYLFACFYALNDLLTSFLGWGLGFHMFGKTLEQPALFLFFSLIGSFVIWERLSRIQGFDGSYFLIAPGYRSIIKNKLL